MVDNLERADLREKAGVDALARVLMEAWAKAEPDHPVTRFTASYVATFADMARAALASALAQRDEAVRAAEKALDAAMDGAGTLPAKEAVKLRPADWHALERAIRAIRARTEGHGGGE